MKIDMDNSDVRSLNTLYIFVACRGGSIGCEAWVVWLESHYTREKRPKKRPTEVYNVTKRRVAKVCLDSLKIPTGLRSGLVFFLGDDRF